MFKITLFGCSTPLYDSSKYAIPSGKFFPRAHLLLWKDNIHLGRVIVDEDEVSLTLENGDKFSYSRDFFQEMLMRNAQILELIFRDESIKEAALHLKGNRFSITDPVKLANARTVRLFSASGNVYEYYGDLYYWKK